MHGSALTDEKHGPYGSLHAGDPPATTAGPFNAFRDSDDGSRRHKHHRHVSREGREQEGAGLDRRARQLGSYYGAVVIPRDHTCVVLGDYEGLHAR